MKKFIIYTASVILILMASCSKEKLNEFDNDPNNPSDVPIRLLIPTVTSGVPIYMNASDIAWYCSIFAEQQAGTYLGMRDADRRSSINASLSENAWLQLYAGVMNDLNIIIKKGSDGGTEAGSWKYVGIAQVLMAYSMSTASDIWGRVPYSEAFKSAEIRAPKFDSQESIYASLQIMLDQAIINLDRESIEQPSNEDLLYNGNTDKWIKAAWSLKAKLYNHLSNRDALGSANNAIACMAKAFGSSDDNLTFTKWSGTDDPDHQNPWYRERIELGRFSLSKTMYDILNVNTDPRLSIFYTGIKAAPNGTAQEDNTGTIYSKTSDNIIYPNAPLPMLTFAELKFIEAECYLRIGNSNMANYCYQLAVDTALAMYNIKANPFTTPDFYNKVLKKEPSDMNLNLIITQKYIALFPYQSVEAFADWRRTGIPTMNNPLGQIRRFPYPQSEISANGANLPVTLTTNGVWWDDGSED